MTFLSPSFIFVFLPIALSIYSLVPKYLKIYALAAIGLVFYTVINLGSPLALIAMPTVIVAVSASVMLYKKKKIRACLEICRIVSVLAIFTVLVLRVIGVVGTLSGVGVIILLMASVSLCADVLWNQARVPDSLWDVLVYLTFFPIFMVGPFVKFGDFIAKTDRLDFCTEGFTVGAVSLASGFVKCVAVSAVLGEAYDLLFGVVSETPGLILTVILVLIRGIGFFNFLSGYSDIAVGISSMLGIRLNRDHGNFFCNVTPCEFIRNFFSGLLDFCRSYITVPVSLIVSGLSGSVVAAVFAAFFYVLLFAHNMETVYTLMIPVTVAMLFIVLRTGKRRSRVPALPKILGCAATFLLASAIVWYIYVGGPDEMLSLLENGLSSPIPLRAYEILGDIKYLILPSVSGLCVWGVKSLFKRDIAYLDARQSGNSAAEPTDSPARLAAKYLLSAILLALFVFTLLMILPQYPYLASANYFFPFM